MTHYPTHPAPTEVGQTNKAWYVHVEGKSVSPLFDYQNRAVGDAMLMTLLEVATPFNPQQFDITGLGYEDITIVVNDKWLAQALVDCLNALMPMASDAWRNSVEWNHVYAVQMNEEAETFGGELFWCGGTEMTDEDPIGPSN
uniref:Uncharacterized protein n=1 Tax=Pseudomonas phage Cygsa01 TaxID=3138529 RepID=A0AAU6W3W9_9VIRU